MVKTTLTNEILADLMLAGYAKVSGKAAGVLYRERDDRACGIGCIMIAKTGKPAPFEVGIWAWFCQNFEIGSVYDNVDAISEIIKLNDRTDMTIPEIAEQIRQKERGDVPQ